MVETEREPVFLPRDRASATEFVIQYIKKLFTEKKLRPGDRLPSEYELSEMTGVSRGSVREAMKTLKAFGVVEIKQGDGTYITRPSTQSWSDPLFFELILTEATIKEFIELRETIENGVLQLVMANATPQDLQRLFAVHQKMSEVVEQQTSPPQELAQLDLTFHLTLGQITHNILLEKIYRFILDFFAPTIEKTYHREKSGTNALRLHQGIIDALLSKNPEKVRIALKESISEWYRLFKEDEL